MKISQYIFTFIFAGIFTLIGVGVLIWGISDSRSALKSRNWPYVTGQVINSYVGESSDDDGTTYSAEIQYTYVVSVRQYTGTRVSHGDISTSNSADAEKIIARYPEGQAVEVFYDPTDPQQSVLQTGFTTGLLLPLGLGTIFTLVGGFMLIGFTFQFIRSRNQPT